MEDPNAKQPEIPAKKDPAVTEPPSPSDPVHKDPGSNDSNLKPEEGSEVAPPTAEATESSTIKSPKSVRWSEQLVSESTFDARPVPAPPETVSVSFKERMNGVKDVLGRWGANVKEAAKKAETLAGNTWQHLKTNPSFADAAMGRIAHSTKILAEGGYDKIFRQTFETSPDEQLKSTYACYLSTSAGPVMGALYVSSLKLAFCSDNPLPYKNADKTEWSYYKVAIPLDQLKAVNSSSSRVNPSEKYIQIISVDGHEFWYMGFLNYEGAVSSLQEALVMRNTQSAV